MEWAEGGRFVRVQIPCGRRGGGRRGEVEGFSRGARRRLLMFVNSIDRSRSSPGQVLFVTLTYGEVFPAAREAKRDLKVILQRFRRAWGTRPHIWKLEPQKRGAPHFHLLLMMESQYNLDEQIKWWASTWAELVGGDELEKVERVHLGRAGGNNKPCCERPNEWGGVLNYVGKYIGKVTGGIEDFDASEISERSEKWRKPGRFWGIGHRELWPIKIEVREVPLRVAVRLRRACVRWYDHQLTGKFWFKLDSRGARWQVVSGDFVKEFGSLGSVRPQLREWPSSRGGCSMFMRDADFKRLLSWAVAEAGCDASMVQIVSEAVGVVDRPGVGSRPRSAGRASAAATSRSEVMHEVQQTRRQAVERWLSGGGGQSGFS